MRSLLIISIRNTGVVTEIASAVSRSEVFLRAFLLSTNQAMMVSSYMDYAGIITKEPGKRGGKPCIRGLRITVYDVLNYLASGMSEDETLNDFPDLTKEDIKACLAFAADRERKLTTIPA